MFNRLVNTVVIVFCATLTGFFVYKAIIDDKYNSYVIVFDEAVSGLLPGSQVLMNGIKVGKIKSLEIPKYDPTKCKAIIHIKEVDPSILEARILYLGISGNKGINLSFKRPPEEMPNIDGLKQIKSSKSILSRLMDSTDSINKDQLNQLLDSFNEIVFSVKAAVLKSNALIESVNQFVLKTIPISQNIVNLSENLNKLSKKVSPAIEKLSKELGKDGDFEFGKTIEDLKSFSKSLKRLSARTEDILNDFSHRPIGFMLHGANEKDQMPEIPGFLKKISC